MLKETIVALSVVTLAGSAAVLPTAEAKAAICTDVSAAFASAVGRTAAEPAKVTTLSATMVSLSIKCHSPKCSPVTPALPRCRPQTPRPASGLLSVVS